MKNFTNNFKQFTSRLSARWLIMALMLLVGTSSVFGAITVRLKPVDDSSSTGSTSGWWYGGGAVSSAKANLYAFYGSNKTQLLGAWPGKPVSVGSDGYITYTFSTGTMPDYIIWNSYNDYSGKRWQTSDIEVTDGYTYTITMSGTSTITYTTTSAQNCTPSTSITSAKLQDGTISLVGNFTTCGAKYHGFQWRKVGSDWCGETDYANNKESNYVTIGNTDVNGSETDSFTPKDGGTYEFRTYIVTTSPWLYSTTTIEVSTCIELPNDAYALSSSRAEWTGSDITPTISKKDENYPTPTITYNGGSALPNKSGEYTIKATVSGDATYCNKEFDLGTFTITCSTIAAPAITTSATVCAGTQVTLSAYNNSNTVKWYSNSACAEEVTEQVTPTNGKVYYAKAYHKESGCYSSEYSTLTFKVNPLPTISIGDNTNAVKFEDVKLTATGNNIADVTWTADKGTITEDATDPKKAVLTYDQTGTVTVTATATSAAGCKSTAATKTVKFSAEVCNNVADMTKIYFDTKGNSNFNDNVYLSVAGNTYNKDRSADCYDTGHAGDYWPGEDGKFHKMTKIAGTNIYYVNKPASIPSGRISIWNKNQQDNDNVWQAHVILAKSIDNNNNCLVLGSSTYHKTRESNVYCSTWTTYKDAPAITTPAVKTVSVTSDEDGNVTMVGQVVKTGCDTQAILGLQYKKQNPDGTTYEANYTTYPNPGTKEAILAGKTFTVTTKLEDGTYLVRARIDNSHATNGYGEDIKVVVNTTKTPISNVTLNYCDENGGNVGVDPNPMCKGATAYVILDYTGSKYSDIKWLVEGVETNLVTDEGDGVWSYEIQGDGSLSVELKNDANTDPAWPYSNKLAFTIIPEPTAPYISIDPASGVICQGSSATIKVENPSKDCSYKLVEEGPKAGFEPYKSGDLTYTVQNVAKYYVVAQHNACTDNEYTSNQVAINQIISTNANISIEPANAETTPWEPVSITVTADEGYVYEVTYTGNNLQDVEGVIIKQKGDTYTYYIPRPTGWGEGNAVSVRTPVSYDIKAQLKVDGEANQCDLSSDTATITVKDEENEDCD